jgi:uncharacterized phage protein (predicted DNA packaging)
MGRKPAALLAVLKEHLAIGEGQDDRLLQSYLAAAVSYAESYQHKDAGHYQSSPLAPVTCQAVLMLAAHFYESRDGGTGGFFADNAHAARQTWETVNSLLRLGRDWSV